MTLRIPNAGSAEGQILEIEWSVTRLLNKDGTLFSPRDSIKIQMRDRRLFCS